MENETYDVMVCSYCGYENEEVKADHSKQLLCPNCELFQMFMPTTFERDVTDTVNHPSHYTFGNYEVLDVIEDWQLDHHKACAVKYIARAGRKATSTEVKDLRKAIVYLQRKVKLLESQK